jgi:hypothetical protein
MADTGFKVNNKSDLLGYIFIHLYLFTLNNTDALITETERLRFTPKWWRVGGGGRFDGRTVCHDKPLGRLPGSVTSC